MRARFDYERFCKLQDAAGLSNTQLAARLDVTESAVRNWRRGAVQPGFALGVALAKALKVQPSALLTTTREA